MGTRLDIQSLPNELLIRIFGEFALQPHETGYPVLFEFKQNRLILLQLCQTTHKLALAASALLYETVIITKPSTLVSLLRTVSQNKGAAQHVKHIACLLTFSADVNSGVQNAWKAAIPQICKTTPDAVRLFRLAGLASGTNTGAGSAEANKASLCQKLGHAGERVFAAVLALLPCLRSIVFQPPHAPSPHSPPPAPYHRMNSILEKVLADQVLGPTALQELTTVKIQPMTQWGEPKPGTRCDACISLLKAPRLTIFEAYNEAGGWDALPPTLKDVRLFGSLEPDTLGTICDIPTLERLTVQPHPEEHEEAAVEDDTFNTALAKRVSTLKYLQLVTMGNETLMSSYGPRKYIHCLGGFQRLEELDIELFALLIDSTNLDPEKWLFQELVPQGLKSLSLWERWSSGDPVFHLEGDDLVAYRDRFHKFLTSIAQSCATGRMPTLRKFRLERHSSLIADRGPVESPAIGRLKKAFADAGVKMEVGIF